MESNPNIFCLKVQVPEYPDNKFLAKAIMMPMLIANNMNFKLQNFEIQEAFSNIVYII